MTRLALVGDAAYPPVDQHGNADASQYPSDMYAVAGYLGGDTPNVWRDQDIIAVRESGRAFWPIWTAPNSKTGMAINAAIGTYDGKQMAVQLRVRGIPQNVPVFYDVEHSTWNADPVGATAAIAAFKREVVAAGWKEAYAYCTTGFNRDWVAKWTNIRPTSLPVDWVGQQFGGRPGLDFSVFDLDKLGVDMISDADAQLIADKTAAVIGKDMRTYIPQYMVAQFGGTVNRIVQELQLDQQEVITLQHIEQQLAAAGTPGSTVDVKALARELESLFGAAATAASTAAP